MKIVMVEWVDSSFSQGWRAKSLLKDERPSKCVSCGILATENEDSVTLVLSISEDSYADTMIIPKGCITNIRRLVCK